MRVLKSQAASDMPVLPTWVSYSIYWEQAYAHALKKAQESGYRFRVEKAIVNGREVWVIGRLRYQHWRNI